MNVELTVRKFNERNLTWMKMDHLCFNFPFLRDYPKLYSLTMQHLRSLTETKCLTRSFSFKNKWFKTPQIFHCYSVICRTLSEYNTKSSAHFMLIYIDRRKCSMDEKLFIGDVPSNL